MTLANKIAYFLVVFVVIFTAMAYGAVHQPILALFYFLTSTIVILWAIDGALSGAVRFNKCLLQLPIYAIGVYGLFQVLPLGNYSVAGVDNIPHTISLDPFSTEMNAVHFIALGMFFSVTLALLNTAKRIRRVVTVLIVFGFFFAFYAILQGVLSPTKIYGIYERLYAQPYGP